MSNSSSGSLTDYKSSVYGKLTESQKSPFFSSKASSMKTTKSSIRLMTSIDSPRSSKKSIARKRSNSGESSHSGGGNSNSDSKNSGKRVFARRTSRDCSQGTFSSRAKTVSRTALSNKKKSVGGGGVFVVVPESSTYFEISRYNGKSRKVGFSWCCFCRRQWY